MADYKEGQGQFEGKTWSDGSPVTKKEQDWFDSGPIKQDMLEKALDLIKKHKDK